MVDSLARDPQHGLIVEVQNVDLGNFDHGKGQRGADGSATRVGHVSKHQNFA
jgi:hypothetical protein